AEPVRDEARIAAARAEAEATLAEIETLARARDVDALVAPMSALRGKIAAYSAAAPQEEVLAQFEVWLGKLEAQEELAELSLALRLHLYVELGNGHLTGLARAIADERYGDALATHERLEAIAGRMEAQERKVFGANAESLRMRGQALAERARTLDTIQRLELD